MGTKIAAVDVGTNSIHLMIGRVGADGRVEVLCRAKEMVRLGDSAFRDGVLSEEAFRKASDTLRMFTRRASEEGCGQMAAVCTSAVRDAENGADFVSRLRAQTGLDLRVISGIEEARLIYLGARSVMGLGGRRMLLGDIGGGSVELMVGDARRLYLARSLRLGVLRLLPRITTDPISPLEHERLAAHCRHRLAKACAAARRVRYDVLGLGAGTARALALLSGEKESVGIEDVRALERRLCAMRAAERAGIPGLDPRRTDSIVAGVILVRTLLEVLDMREYLVCEAGLREGLILRLALGAGAQRSLSP